MYFMTSEYITDLQVKYRKLAAQSTFITTLTKSQGVDVEAKANAGFTRSSKHRAASSTFYGN